MCWVLICFSKVILWVVIIIDVLSLFSLINKCRSCWVRGGFMFFVGLFVRSIFG